MAKPAVCRICLVGNVRMHNVLDKKLQELYEKLTSIPFDTEDGRPSQACYICYARLQKCQQFVMQCLDSEKMFLQMYTGRKENINPNKMRRNLAKNSFSIHPLYHISIVEPNYVEHGFIKEELPDVLEENIDMTLKDHQEIEFELESIPNSNQEDCQTSQEPLLVTIKTEVSPFRNKRLHFGYEQDDSVTNLQSKNVALDNQENVIKTPVLQNIDDSNDTTYDYFLQTQTSHVNSADRDYIIEIETEHLPNPYACDECLQSFSSKCALTNHILTHTGEKPYQCEVCQRSFRQKIALKIHMRSHTGEKPYKCNICQRSFSENATLRNHMYVHNGIKPYSCDICHRSFRKRAHLNVHIFSIHTAKSEKPLQCHMCSQRFAQRCQLTNHIRIHTGERPFKCDTCQCSFRSKDCLNKHMSSHSEKPFKCGVCPSSFRRKSHLNAHMRTHTGEKPYKCEHCEHSFVEKVALTRHLVKHTGVKPYQCDVCQRSYGMKGQLNRHMTTHM